MAVPLTISVDDRGLSALIATWSQKKGKTMREGLKTAGRSICKALMQYTLPRENMKMESRVRGDVGSVYISRSKVYSDIFKRHGRQVASGFWAALTKRRAPKVAEKILNKYSIYSGIKTGSFDGGAAHRAARTGPRGSVPKHWRGSTIILEQGKKSTLSKYVEKKVKNVGMAKAGWVAVWRTLGGIKDVPAWVARSSRNSDLGVAIMSGNDSAPGLVLHNKVRHARPSLDERYLDYIVDAGMARARDYFIRQLKLR